MFAGVSALERGDFNYKLDSAGGDEIAELARAFDFGCERAWPVHTELAAPRSARRPSVEWPVRSLTTHPLAAIARMLSFSVSSSLRLISGVNSYEQVSKGWGE